MRVARAILVTAVVCIGCLAQEPTAQSHPGERYRFLLDDFDVKGLIRTDNDRPGEQGWRVVKSPLSRTEVAAFVDRVSAFPDDTISLYGISQDSVIAAVVYRIGWYAGMGARRVLDIGEARAPATMTCKGFAPQHCAWSKVLSFVVPENSAPGVYVVKYRNRRGAGGFIPFVVRPLWRARMLVVLSFNTYQAYNSWGGYSLYRLGDGTSASVAVTFWRPYTPDVINDHFMGLDVPLISFLERWGYPVEYASDVDFHTENDLAAESRAVIFSGHGEYWSSAMRDNAERLVSAGIGVGFFGANDGYWQVRYEDLGNPNAQRTMVCYKSAEDPLINRSDMATVLFRDRHIARPENGLLGVMHPLYASPRQFIRLIVKTTTPQLFEGTGLVPGDSTSAIGGWEGDRIENNGATPANLIVLFETPFINKEGNPDVMQTTLYRGRGGGLVFAAGTVSWNRAFLPQGGSSDERLQRFARNLLDAFVEQRYVSLGQPRPFTLDSAKCRQKGCP